MTYVKQYRCTLCGRTYPSGFTGFVCPACGETGILDVVYDYEAMKDVVTASYFSTNHDHSIWRYLPLMSIAGDHHGETLHTGWTPLYRARRLAAEIGLDTLYVKDEGLNPTASMKDRASAVAVLDARAKGYDVVACSSTGNAASSLAGQAARLGLASVIFVPRRAPIGKVTQLLVYGATVISVEGDYKAAYELSRAAIAHYGWYNRNAAINPHLVEGKKTVAFEIAEQLQFQVPDWVAVSVGDGCTIAGVYKGFYDLFQLGLISRIPKLLGVQAAGCAPFVAAARAGRPLEESDEDTIADSIAVGIPRNPVKAQNAVRHSEGAWIAVPDSEILAMMKTFGNSEGIFGEPAGVAGLAGVKAAVNQGIIGRGETVAAIMTGNGLKDPVNAGKAVGTPASLKPDLSELIAYMRRKGQ